jgi:hypothetical protein
MEPPRVVELVEGYPRLNMERGGTTTLRDPELRPRGDHVFLTPLRVRSTCAFDSRKAT